MFIDERYVQLKEEFSLLLNELYDFSLDFDNKEIRRIIKEFKRRADSPFLFVIIGEVKAGKSSFINALLGEQVCEVSSVPCTAQINEISYSDKPYSHSIDGEVKKIGVNAEILKSITIVDTPGTNSIVEQHQKITEDYIPNSDLVAVLFSAKNPHTMSVWELFKFVKSDWGKRAIFILQQKDTTTEEELEQNLQSVKSYAMQNGIYDPVVFCVSAKMESDGNSKESGFSLLNEYIRNTITGSNDLHQKLKSNIDTIKTIIDKINESIERRSNQNNEDKSIIDSVNKALEQGRNSALEIMKYLANILKYEYDIVANQTKDEFRKNIDIDIIKLKFKTVKDIEIWLQKLNDDFTKRIQDTVERNSQQSMKEYLLCINSTLEKTFKKMNDRQIFIDEQDEFYGNMTSKRERMVKELKNRVNNLLEMGRGFIASGDNAAAFVADFWKKDRQYKIGGTTVGGGVGTAALLALGLTIGGPLAWGSGVAILLACLGAGWFGGGKVSDMKNLDKIDQMTPKFSQELENQREKFHADIENKLQENVKKLFNEIELSFADFRIKTYEDEEIIFAVKEKIAKMGSDIERIITLEQQI